MTKKKTKIAIIPLGYADGYARVLGNGNGHMMIDNKLIPTVGNICMDMTFLDVTNNIKEGDRVEVFGAVENKDLANEANTIPYEILSCISHRGKVYEKRLMKRKFVSNLILVLVLNFIIKPFYILGIDAEILKITELNNAGTYGTYFSLLSLSFVFNNF